MLPFHPRGSDFTLRAREARCEEQPVHRLRPGTCRGRDQLTSFASAFARRIKSRQKQGRRHQCVILRHQRSARIQQSRCPTSPCSSAPSVTVPIHPHALSDFLSMASSCAGLHDTVSDSIGPVKPKITAELHTSLCARIALVSSNAQPGCAKASFS